MKPEQQQIAIAEACGYSRQEPDSSWFDSPNDGQIHIEDLPDYINDLNAMHEAEKTLDDVTQIGDYWDYLFSITGGEFEMCHAPAAQRAEAFLRTLGRWEE